MARLEFEADRMIQMVKTIIRKDMGSDEPCTMGNFPIPQTFDWDSKQLKRFFSQLGIKFAS